jgi:hypothetical protein
MCRRDTNCRRRVHNIKPRHNFLQRGMKTTKRLHYFQHGSHKTKDIRSQRQQLDKEAIKRKTETTTIMPVIDHKKVSRDDLIRARLLHTLGIQKPANRDTIEKREHTSVNNLLSNDAPIRRRLNDSKEEHNKKGHVRRLSRKRLVRFNSIVKEKPIASHKRYTDRIKRTMWSDTEEIQENAYRNQIEYQAEGMKWESVLEDDEMYMDAKTGELIHPFWVESEDAKMLFS